MVPSLPPNMRFAVSDDLHRLGLVATAGYAAAPQFLYMSPYFSKYPGDTLASYQESYRARLLEPRAGILVVEDELNINEKDGVCDELAELCPSYSPECQGQKVIVAVTSFALPERCQWVVDRKASEPPKNIPPTVLHRRDGSKDGQGLLRDAITPILQKKLVDRATITAMVVHPAYRGNRYGDAIMKWIGAFFAEQRVGYSLAATPDGLKLYLRNGARETGSVEVPGYIEHPESFTISFCDWDPPITQ